MTEVAGGISGALAGRYRIERELGRAEWPLSTSRMTSNTGAMLQSRFSAPNSPRSSAPNVFCAKSRPSQDLQHPHILGLIDSGEVNGTAFYVMPFVSGESLRDRLKREKQLPIADAVRIATEVAAALDYAHRHGVIHRDIKPENISEYRRAVGTSDGRRRRLCHASLCNRTAL